MPREEVMKILGRTDLGRARPEAGPNGDSSCRYPGRVQGSVTIALGAMSKAEFDEFRKLLVDQGKKPESIAGVADAAYFWDDNSLYALSGKIAVKVAISPTPGTESSKTKANLLALARAVVSKVKGGSPS